MSNSFAVPSVSGGVNRPDFSIRINIDDNIITMGTNNTAPRNIPRTDVREHSRLHTVINRMRHHTLGSTVGRTIGGDWRMNLDDVISFSRAPTTRLRSLISQSGNFRYMHLNNLSSNRNNLNDNVHILRNNSENLGNSSITTNSSNLSRLPSRRREDLDVFSSVPAFLRRENYLNTNGATNFLNINVPNFNSVRNNNSDEEAQQQLQQNVVSDAVATTAALENAQPVQHASLEDDSNNPNNVFSDTFIREIGNFFRYLPFLGILFVKFIFDNFLGIIDLAVLQSIMYMMNKSLRHQVSKFSQKNYIVLCRDFCIIVVTVTCRLMLATAQPDPWGLIIRPPKQSVTIGFQKSIDNSITSQQESESSTIIVSTQTISLLVLIYYVTVNDLLMKILSILTKICITMLPNTILRHKQRARLYVLVEYCSQLYRATAPIHQWILYLFDSYKGFDLICGTVFSAVYMGAKGIEIVHRGKALISAFEDFYRNKDYERKPTKEELDLAGEICPICHDAYNTPIILTCNHIFCDDCATQWFNREQTCPMCRAKVSKDPQWQDGSTTFVYQIF